MPYFGEIGDRRGLERRHWLIATLPGPFFDAKKSRMTPHLPLHMISTGQECCLFLTAAGGAETARSGTGSPT